MIRLWYAISMRLNINWKAGIVSGIVVTVVGIALFIFAGSKIDFTCKNETTRSSGCRVYHGVNVVIQGYSDVWRSVFAKRCVGGNGPDDCIGPDAMIMLGTLFAIGFVAGNVIWREKR